MSDQHFEPGECDLEISSETGEVRDPNRDFTITGHGGGGSIGYNGGTIDPIDIKTVRRLNFFLSRDDGGISDVKVVNPSVGVGHAHRVTVIYAHNGDIGNKRLAGLVNHTTGENQIIIPALEAMWQPRNKISLIAIAIIGIAVFIGTIVVGIEYFKMGETISILLAIAVVFIVFCMGSLYLASWVKRSQSAFLKRAKLIVRGAIEAAVEQEKGRTAS